MNKFFKITVVAAITLTVTGVFAAPPPRKHHPHNNKGNDGVRLATDIVNLVDASLRLLTGTPETVIVNNTPPAVVVPTAPVVVTQPQQTVIVNNPPPVQTNTVIINNNNRRPVMRPVAKPVRYHYGRPRTIKVKHNFAAQPKYRF